MLTETTTLSLRLVSFPILLRHRHISGGLFPVIERAQLQLFNWPVFDIARIPATSAFAVLVIDAFLKRDGEDAPGENSCLNTSAFGRLRGDSQSGPRKDTNLAALSPFFRQRRNRQLQVR